MRGLFRAGIVVGLLTLMGSSPPADAPRPGGGQGEMGGKRRPGAGKPKLRAEKRGDDARAGKKKGEGKAGMRAAKGNMFLRQGSPRAAVASFRKQLEESPDSTALHIGLGKSLARLGRCEEALDHLWPYVGTLPFGAEAALSASTCSSRIGLLDDAVYFDRIAVDLDPTSARALTNLALDLSSAGDEAGAAEALDDLLFLRPERDASNYARAVLALRTGDLDTFDLVIEAWERDDGASLDMRRLQAQAWLDMDNPPAAMAALENVRRMRNGQQVRHLRSEALRRTGYTAEAAGYLQDRPQSVLEGVDSDAVRVRVHVDERDFAAAHAVLDNYDVIDDAELIASAWYLAAAEGRTDALAALQAEYEHVRTSPLRQLSHLEPWTTRKD